MTTLTLCVTVNGVAQKTEIEARTLLVDYLREHLRLTGAHVGCDTSQCGACTVLMDGRAVKACTVLAAQADGADVTTIEGLADVDGTLHPVQEAFREHHGLQCGFCTPGMVLRAKALIDEATNAELSDEEVRNGLEGNFCRCTGYQNIVRAVKAAAASLKAGG